MAEPAEERFYFRPPNGTEGWTENFMPGRRRSPNTGSVIIAKVAKPSLKRLLLAPGTRTEALAPAREPHSLRPPPTFE